ncbi:MAG TPA: N-acetylmuramoyl-L-alanine amidase [Bacteroidales bacterium]|nr:N-acetylmuramoyl-L-alanine amidase [Bacteroidales bacterium]
MPRHLWTFTVLIIFLLPCALVAQRKSSIRTIVIDAGHGGHDPGALGRMSKEKNINLAIALKLGNMIQRNLKDVRVVYTRDRDYFVELYRRAEIANESKADLFISIHCNANHSRALQGAETYIMGLHKSQANLNIAKLENASILLESGYQETYGGFDPNSDESYIAFSLNQNSNLDQSTDFASLIQNQMAERVGMNDRGVRQAGFIVLWKTTMPSVLVEVGYLSNASEEKFLISGKGQDYIASAIYRALKEFRERNATMILPGSGSSELQVQPATNPVLQNPEATSYQGTRSASTVSDTRKKARENPAGVGGASGITFRVQVAVSTTELSLKSAKFAGLSKVKMYRHNGMYKYTVGDEKSLQGAEKLLKEVKRRGVNDAFIVVFRDNQRISQEEADRIMGK